MLSSELDPAPGSLYASGADGTLIRATLAHSVEMNWGIGLADVRTAFLLAPRPKPVESREVIVDTCLVYRPRSKDHGALGTLQVPRHERLLEAFADISFAPNGDRSHQGIIVCAAGSPIQWEASRQAFHTMSTAEAELVGYCEAATMLKSVEALMKVIHRSCQGAGDEDGFEKVVYGDNSRPEDTKDEIEENDFIIKKVKAIVCIAALSTAAASKAFAADLRLKCAQTVLGLAKWLAANWCTPPSDEGRSKEDSWMNPVVRSKTPWVGYTFFEMTDGAAEELGNYVEPAAPALHVPWPSSATRSTSQEVHGGRRGSTQNPAPCPPEETPTPRMGRPYRPHYEPGLHVGPLRNQGGVVGSGSKTLSSQESQLALPEETYVTMDDSMPSLGYAPGGVIERGRVALGIDAGRHAIESLDSSSSEQMPPFHEDFNPFRPSPHSRPVPQAYTPLTEVWPAQEVDDWSFVTDDEDDEDCP
eukprot:s4968_g6.t1